MQSNEDLQNETSALFKLVGLVEQLYEFRDHYFERNPIEKANQKSDDVETEMKKTLKKLDELQGEAEKEDRAQFLMLKGRALNIAQEFTQEAEDALSKAVKLNPKLSKAWNELGYSYWKKGDVVSAKNSFEGALRHGKCKVSLRSLSMILRQLGSDNREKMKNIHDSLQKAKEAVELDMDDGVSWYILGNAYLSLFFVANQLPSVLKQCMTAYSKAQQDNIAKCLPDLHYNMATAFRYDEKYQEALAAYNQAMALDPLWTEPKEKEEGVLEYLREIQNRIGDKGNLKPRRLQNIIKSIKPHHLGPYGSTPHTTVSGKCVVLKKKSLSELAVGFNSQVVVLGKVVCCIPSPDSVPVTFCMVDDKTTCLAVTVYNMAYSKSVVIGDSVAIPEPIVESVHFKHKDDEIIFQSIRISSPVSLVVNGHKLGMEQHIPTQFSVKCSSD